MKTFLLIVGFLCLVCAVLATPAGIGYGLYEWVVTDIEFKFALWAGVKLWLTMLIGGLAIGFPLYTLNS